METWQCEYCRKVLFDASTRVCRWRTAKIEFVPNGSHGPMPTFMAKCPQCKNYLRLDLPAMLSAARSQWEAVRSQHGKEVVCY